ncbi:DUF393 domain-containing protein [Candidatus Pelagibacter sp.]|nr:DUF393 domain-containing protein [Candidatus Pelagibacter sp.]
MKVYYNESCSICRAEINHYKKQNIDEIDWVDITNNVTAEKETLKDDKTLLRRLHVKKDGKIFSGAEAFLIVWKNIPKYKFLYSILKLPLIFQIFSLTYEVVAFFLYLKNKKQIKTS